MRLQPHEPGQPGGEPGGGPAADEGDHPVDDSDGQEHVRPRREHEQVRKGEHPAKRDREPPALEIVRNAQSDRMRPLRRSAGECGVPLLEEGRDALVEVRRPRQLRLRRCLPLELRRERRRLGLVQQALRLPDGAGGHGSEQRSDLVCALGELLVVDDLGDETPVSCLVGGQAAPGRQPLERASRSEQPAHEPGPARVGDEPDLDERGHEARGAGGDPDITRERERHPGAGSGAVHRRNHRLLERPDRKHVAVVVLAEVLRDIARAGGELLQILADAEAATCARDHLDAL